MDLADDISTCCSNNVEESFTILKSLGKGKYAEVKEVKDKFSKKHFAWKRIDLKEDPFNGVEVQLLKRVKHENIIRVHDVYANGSVIDVMLELCSGGSLSDYIDSNFVKCGGYGGARSGWSYCGPQAWESALILHQMLKAVNFLHENSVAHRDIKPGNLLLSKSTWKLADFNLACEFDPRGQMTEEVGTRGYAAPEVHEQCYTEKCDLYSIGVTFMKLVIGSRPGDEEKEVGLLDQKVWRNAAGHGALELTKQMLAPEPQRCDAEEALKNPWLMQHVGGNAGCCVIS
ncbi:Calcium/calmodulin-dependent protein kinase type 1G (CaM kinase I gamma) (CaM kinase IG) (CaM-KI gamma) (CaMKI gamma) (CaMKIG) (CaMK-like CREB kinase III) (CLICK III) [Durusdinium trenchii]|uniref:Calcium/calmodulin-dependent protein kinase type 1G (CaM kinase I gamma) (CaM kinase IG) (CaM-KI gamma) (CaMKI gamma) (CaMKIG) (CaMK-like CREB kinase III) (CLICK III) n=1 Tax=Durusdinium trenchii TaxID=1381693 RepID=A0ABP0LQB0_9DINO